MPYSKLYEICKLAKYVSQVATKPLIQIGLTKSVNMKCTQKINT